MTDDPTPQAPEPEELDPDGSPFPMPPLETQERGKAASSAPIPGPSESPFELPAIAGLPYEKGGEEDRAVQQVIEEAERERRRHASS